MFVWVESDPQGKGESAMSKEEIIWEFAQYGAGYSEEDGLQVWEREEWAPKPQKFIVGLDLLGIEDGVSE